MWAFANDLFQRGITLNKWEQRRKLAKQLRSLNLPTGAKAVDFGCGTALFARTFKNCGLQYFGYDIDPRLTRYAKTLHPFGSFFTDPAKLREEGPFDLIVANCCFHHISDEQLTIELNQLKSMLKDNGVFLMIDLLLNDNDPSFLRQQFRKLEKGAYVRLAKDYKNLVEKHFKIRSVASDRSHVLSIPGNPVYNDLVILQCAKP